MSGEGLPEEEVRPQEIASRLLRQFACRKASITFVPSPASAGIQQHIARKPLQPLLNQPQHSALPRLRLHCWCFSASQADPGPLSYLSHLQHSATTLPSSKPHDRCLLSLTLRKQLPLLCAYLSPLPTNLLACPSLFSCLGCRAPCRPLDCLARRLAPSRPSLTKVWL
jgi:hypothetical protein